MTTMEENFPEKDEQVCEVCGPFTFWPPVEVLPKTRRNEEIQKRKLEELQRKKEAAERLRKQKEKEEAQRRKEERQAQKQKVLLEQQRKEEDKQRREQEGLRKRLEGDSDVLTVSSCRTDGDEAGTASRGVHAARTIGEALQENTRLRSLDLENNNLTACGTDQTGVIALADSLLTNRSLKVLMLSGNAISAEAGEHFIKAVEANDAITLVDLAGNDASLTVDQFRRLQAALQRNRDLSSSARRAQRRERHALYMEEFRSRQDILRIEAMRLEVEAHEERRLVRMKARFEKWAKEIAEELAEEDRIIKELEQEAADRAEANKAASKAASKGKKGKEKKKPK